MDFQLTDEQRHLAEVVAALARDRLAPNGFVPAGDELPREQLRVLAAQGLAGITVPEEDGGQGASLLDAVLAIEAAAQHSASAADALQALNFGAMQQIARLGDAEQKRRFLAPALAGEELVTVAMTEAEAGSAVTDLRASARAEGDEVVLRGQKVFTTHGAVADTFVVWVKFGEGTRSTGAVLVPRGAEGFTVDATHRHMSGERYGMLYLDDCRLPAENVLVWEDGFARLISVFNVERLGNAARSVGYGQAALHRAIAHGRERRQFGRRLVEFQGLQWRYAEMALKVESARLLLYRAAANADAGLPSALETSLAKLACNRAGFEVADDALQIHGAYGYEEEAELSYMFRRTRGWQIAGGSIEQMLNRIASEVLGERFPQRPPKPKHPVERTS